MVAERTMLLTSAQADIDSASPKKGATEWDEGYKTFNEKGEELYKSSADLEPEYLVCKEEYEEIDGRLKALRKELDAKREYEEKLGEKKTKAEEAFQKTLKAKQATQAKERDARDKEREARNVLIEEVNKVQKEKSAFLDKVNAARKEQNSDGVTPGRTTELRNEIGRLQGEVGKKNEELKGIRAKLDAMKPTQNNAQSGAQKNDGSLDALGDARQKAREACQEVIKECRALEAQIRELNQGPLREAKDRFFHIKRQYEDAQWWEMDETDREEWYEKRKLQKELQEQARKNKKA